MRKVKKISVSNASLKELKTMEETLQKELQIEKSYIKYNDLNHRQKKLKEIKEAFLHNSHLIENLKTQKRLKTGLLNHILYNTELTPEAQNKIDKGYKIQDKLREQLLFYDETGCKIQLSAMEEIQKLERKLFFLRKKIQSKMKSNEQIIILKNKAATEAQEKRVIGGSLKRHIEKNAKCPYCLELILGGGHIDHIYPIAKGGHSVVSNMVHVCANCNTKKSDLTLNQFIDKFRLDKNGIEIRLKNLGQIF